MRGPLPADVQPVENETLHRTITGFVTVVPFLALGLAAWQVWGSALHWSDIGLFLGLYFLNGLGITVGFHRCLTHRAFKTHRWLRGLLAILGSAAIEGPVISWVADHRKHHAFADVDGDPHSPHVDHGVGWSGALRGLIHNSHHAFPTSSTHGLRRWQIDISALLIDGLEKVDLAWDVVRISPERLAAKAASATLGSPRAQGQTQR